MNTTQVAEKILETQKIVSQGLKVLNYFQAILHIPENVDKRKKNTVKMKSNKNMRNTKRNISLCNKSYKNVNN